MLTNPAYIEWWLKSMSIMQYLNLTSNNSTQTQALYSACINILGQQSGWYKVTIPGQPTLKNGLSYPGWVPTAQVLLDASYSQLQLSKLFMQVDKSATATLYWDAWITEQFMNISYNMWLLVISQFGPVIQVAVPSSGLAYMLASNATVYTLVSAILYLTGQDLVRVVKLFLSYPYL